jgi:group II intron reverse transcriptase/maturase
MYGSEGSDDPIVLEKRLNKGKGQLAESVEGRGSAKGNAGKTATNRTLSRAGVSNGLTRVREAAQRERCAQMTALLHHVDEQLLEQSYHSLNPRAAAGVDGVTWQEYGKGLSERIRDLHRRVHTGHYRAKPSKRIYLDKPDGQERPIGIAALEDKIVQHAVGRVLGEIFETEFAGISYGFRPGRSQHNALDALYVGLTDRRINWVLDADIEKFFDRLKHEWMMEFLANRVGDRRILRLVRKWLRAGVSEEGTWSKTTEGIPQGAVISPLLANIYLHYVFDQWTMEWREKRNRGDMIVVRYADDIIIGFEDREEAVRYRKDLEARLKRFGLALNPDKTRLIRFGRCEKEEKPDTFMFLGFRHQCGRTRKGAFKIRRTPDKKRMRRTLKRIKLALRNAIHSPVQDTGRWLTRVLRGYFQYYGVPGTRNILDAFRTEVLKHWHTALRRRSQKSSLSWARFLRIALHWLPKARIAHPYPSDRFYATHPRQEPCALGAHARICAGGAR